jgi:hypothetical protein
MNSKITNAKNIAIISIIILIIGLLLYLLFLYVNYDIIFLWSLLLISFGFAFMIGSGIKYWVYKKN